MATFPSAAAQIQPQDPLKQYGEVVSLQHAMQQQQLGQQAIEEGQISLQSTKAFQRAYQEAEGDPSQTAQLAAKYGAKPQDIAAWQAHIADVTQKQASTQKDVLANQQSQHDRGRALLQGVLDAPIDQQPMLYGQALATAHQEHLLDDLPPQLISPTFPGTDKVKQYQYYLNTGSKINEEAIALQKANAETSQAASRAQQAQTSADEFKAKTDPQSPLYNPTAAAIAAGVQSGDPLLTKIYNQEVKEAGDKARAEAPSRIAVAVAEARVHEMFQNDQNAMNKIQSEGLKPYEDKMRSIDQLTSAIAQANAGNSAAAAATLEKLMGVANPDGTKRLSPVAAQQFMQMGSVGQRLIGTVEKVMNGDRWTPQLSSDIQEFAKQSAADATSGLNRTIADTQALYHSTAGSGLTKPVQQQTQGGGMVTVQIPGSPPGQIPASSLERFKKDHPNATVSQ